MLSLDDELAIRELQATYARAVATADPELLETVFADDAVLEERSLTPPLRYAGKGPGGVRNFVVDWASSRPTSRGRQHWVGPTVFQGGPPRCAAFAYVLVPTSPQVPGRAPYVNYLGAYEDHLRKDGDRWLFESRVIRAWDPAIEITVPPAQATAVAATRAGLSSADRLEADELMAEYAWALDTADRDTWLGLFSPDATVECVEADLVRPTRRGARRFAGARGLEELFDLLLDDPTFAGHQHWNSAPIVIGDASRCRAQSFAILPARQPGGTIVLDLVGFYDDELIRHDGRWRFKSRAMRAFAGEVLAGFPEFSRID